MLIGYKDSGEIVGFFDEEYPKDKLPKNVEAISDEAYNAFFLAQNTKEQNAHNFWNREKKVTEFKEIEASVAVELTREEKIERLKQEFLARVDATLNATAHERGYDNIHTAVSYAGYENKFQAEGISFGKWRSNVYEWGYALLEKIEKGEVDINSVSIDETLKSMPVYEGVKNG